MGALVSIIIPVYNVEAYLDQCLDSVVKQTYSNIEIVLVDDGSKDSSGEKCERWKKMDDRIMVLHKENGGMSDARNVGLNYCSGEYVVFVDSDDYVAYTLVEQLMMAQKVHGEITGCCLKRFSRGQEPACECSFGKTRNVGKKEYFKLRGGYFCVGMLYEKAVLTAAECLFDTSLKNVEDAIFNSRAMLYFNSISFVDKELYFYRVNPNSITSKSKDVKWQVQSWIAAYCSLINNIDMKNLSIRQRIEFKRYCRMCLNNIYGEINAAGISYASFVDFLEEGQKRGMELKEPGILHFTHRCCLFAEYMIYKVIFCIMKFRLI